MKKLSVPYISQWDADANFSKDDCVPTCASMLVSYYGGAVSVNELTKKTGIGLVSFPEIESALKAFGHKILGTSFRTMEDLKKSIDAGIPFIAIIHYGDLPNKQDTYTGGHAVVVRGYDEEKQTIITNDPDFWSPRREEGNGKEYPMTAFSKAWQSKADGNNPGNMWFLDAKVPTSGFTLETDIPSEVEDKYDLKTFEWYSKYWTFGEFIGDSIKTHNTLEKLEDVYKNLKKENEFNKTALEKSVQEVAGKNTQIETLQKSNSENTAQLSVMGEQVKEANRQKGLADTAKAEAEVALDLMTIAKGVEESKAKALEIKLTQQLKGYSWGRRFKSLFGFY